MARRGGYSRSTNDEWMRVERRVYGEALRSADDMGQDLDIWLTDAIQHHSYRCELIQAKQRYRQACEEAAATRNVSPLESDFMPTRSAPTITRREGQGSSTGNQRSYRP